jgi:hypothetical protein
MVSMLSILHIGSDSGESAGQRKRLTFAIDIITIMVMFRAMRAVHLVVSDA